MTHLNEPHYDANNPECNTGPTIKQVLDALGPRTIEGDQGRWTGHSVDDAIKADEYDRKVRMSKGKGFARRVLLSITGIRLRAHDGRGS